MIEVKNLYRTYKMGKEELTVLNDVSLKIEKGEFVAIVGPSGSGKFTLMNMIGALDTPTKGSIIIDGEDISKYKDSHMSKFRNEKIGFVFQAFNLESSLTAAEEKPVIPSKAHPLHIFYDGLNILYIFLTGICIVKS
jgi:putative ABC transport system ATP-binding protein